MAPSRENEEFIVVSSDLPEYAQNTTKLPPLAAALDPRGSIGRDGKRSSASRRSSRQDPLDRLRALPEIRPIPWYPGKELPIEKSTMSERVQTRSACLMASRGKINDPPCSHCATGLGRFSKCVSLDEFLSGACSTCHLAARGNSCSIRLKASTGTQSNGEEQEDAQGSQAGTDSQRESHSASAQPEPEPESHASPRQHSPHFTRRAKEARQPTQTPTSSWTPVEHSSSNLKRKRETLQGTDVWKPYVSPYRPIEPSPRGTPASSRSPNSFTPANTAREELPLLNYIYRKDAPMNGTGQYQDTGRVSSPASMRPSDRAWRPAAQNTSRATPSNEYANQSARREISASISPSTQLLEQQQHIHPPEPGEPVRARRSERGIGSRPTPHASLFDSLPRRKQGQVNDIINGLQSDIENSLQKAESMQKQLDTLRSILGIEEGQNNGAATS